MWKTSLSHKDEQGNEIPEHELINYTKIKKKTYAILS